MDIFFDNRKTQRLFESQKAIVKILALWSESV